MINKIKFEISFETNNLQEKDYSEIMDVIKTQMHKNNPDGISLDKFVKILSLDKIKFHPTAIHFPDLETDDDYSIKETKVEIVA